MRKKNRGQILKSLFAQISMLAAKKFGRLSEISIFAHFIAVKFEPPFA